MRKNVKERLNKIAVPFSNSVDIPQPELDKLIYSMNQILADLIVGHWQIKTAHWNLKGPQFLGLHKMFDEMAEIFIEQADRIAERITALGGLTEGTVRRAIELTGLPEYSTSMISATKHAREIKERLRMFVKRMRQVGEFASRLGELETESMLIEFSELADKYAWFLDSVTLTPR